MTVLICRDTGSGEDAEGLRLQHNQRAAVHEIHELLHGFSGNQRWHGDFRVTQQQLVLEEGAAGRQDAGVCTERGVVYPHGHVAEEALGAAACAGLPAPTGSSCGGGCSAHGLCARCHGWRRRVTRDRVGMGVGEGGKVPGVLCQLEGGVGHGRETGTVHGPRWGCVPFKQS